MKVKGFIITGIILSILGIGITAVASTQINFDEEFHGIFTDPNLEEKKQSFGDIETIVYHGTDENLDIVYGEGENTFTYYESESLTYEIGYNEEKKELEIIQKHTFTFFNFSFLNKKATLFINSSLDSVEINATAGNIGIKNLTIDNANIDVNAGNLKLENTTFSSLIVKSDAGNVNANQLTTDIGNFDVKAGNLKLVDSNIKHSTIISNAGNVNLVHVIFDEVNARLNAGNFTFTGDISSHGEFRLDAGNMNLKLSRSKDAYTINGEGSGESVILYKISAGNKKIYFSE